MKDIILSGYSGHAWVIADVFLRSGYTIKGYFEREIKARNPFNLEWLGDDQKTETLFHYKNQLFFPAIGDNMSRAQLMSRLLNAGMTSVNAIDPLSHISKSAHLATRGIFLGSFAVINPEAIIEEGVICNTSSVVEHECKVGKFVHVGPGAVLCGNVSIGDYTFIGAGSVIKEGVSIGSNVIIGAGSVIIKDVKNNAKIVGNPGRML